MAIVILGMHRSGTSCLAGMLDAAGLASAGEAVRNWDNARGHHEMLDVVRLDEAVLAHSGGHWLSPPAEVRWTAEHAAARDAILTTPIGGLPPLLKDPRMLLVLPFWRASRVPFRAVGIVRHPLAVARSLESWREMPLAEGIALWTAHNRVLADDHVRHGDPLIDFDAPKAEVVAAVVTAFGADAARVASAYEERLVHHDAGDAQDVAGLAEALALYRELGGARAPERRFPRAELAEAVRLARTDAAAALARARAAVSIVADPAAVVIPVITAFVRARAFEQARALIADARLDAGLADLLHGKVLLAIGDARGAVRHLTAACAAAQPFYQARHLLPQALRAAGQLAEARAAMHAVAAVALYPHGPLATLAEWSWLDGNRDAALAEMQRAIDAAPPHRRGRLRTRRAEWLLAGGERDAARDELLRANVEDPAYIRSREVLASIA